MAHDRMSKDKADELLATVKLTSSHFGGQFELPNSVLYITDPPTGFIWFNAGSEVSKVQVFQLFFARDCVPRDYSLSHPGVLPVYLNIVFPGGDPLPAPVRSGSVRLEVFDLEHRHVQGTLEEVVVEIKPGSIITLNSGFFSSPPNFRGRASRISGR